MAQLDQLARDGSSVSLPERLYLAMASCYFGAGPRFREVPGFSPEAQDLNLRQPTTIMDNRTERPEGGNNTEGKIPGFTPVMIHRTQAGIPRGVAPGARPREVVPPIPAQE